VTASIIYARLLTPQALQGRAIALSGFRIVSLILRNGFVPSGEAKRWPGLPGM
jgi:hypothetical protein